MTAPTLFNFYAFKQTQQHNPEAAIKRAELALRKDIRPELRRKLWAEMI